MNPYCLRNQLTEAFVPWEGGDPLPPPYPSRVQAFIMACANFAAEEEIKLAGGKTQTRAARA